MMSQSDVPPAADLHVPARLIFYRLQPFAPDRLRSFLKYLRERESLLRIGGFPADLYRASEQLARPEAVLHLTSSADHQPESELTLRMDSQHAESVLSLDFGALRPAIRVLASATLLDLLVTGARMLGAQYAVMDRIAAWVEANSALLAERAHIVAGLTMMEEQWDGAQVWLRSETPGASAVQQQICALLLDPQADRTDLLQTFARALRASDWRVRICAMIGAARHGLTELGLAVKQTDIPQTSVPGVTNEVRHLLLAMRKAAVLLLSGTPLPAVELVASNTRVGMQAHLLRLMAGEPPAFRDEFADLIDSLIHPGGK